MSVPLRLGIDLGTSKTVACLTRPEAQRGRLQEAARRAGLGTAWLVAEPVAAAAFCLRRQPVAGPHLVVFDLVGVAVIRHEPGLGPVPFRVLATAPLRDVSLIRDVVVRAGLTGPPDAVFLIGEPHLAAQVHAALGVAPTVVDQ